MIRANRFLNFSNFFVIAILSVSSNALADFDHTHAAWKDFLQAHVAVTDATSTVDYRAVKADSSKLNPYLAKLGKITKTDFEAFTRPQRLALLINAYNAFTIKLIVDNYPVKSIKDIGGLFSSPWKKKDFAFLGSKISLDYIEHDMIRPVFHEPRIHFALVCASKGCPGLPNVPFLAEDLSAQLEASSNKFLKDKTRNSYDSGRKTLILSSIFKWYKDDLSTVNGSVKTFVAPFMTTNAAEQAQIVSGDTKIEYLEYDWTLNEK